MSRARMPLAERIMLGEQVHPYPAIAVIEAIRSRAVVIQSVRVDAQAASDIFWGSKQREWHINRDFGALRLPYPNMWFEWGFPATHDLSVFHPRGAELGATRFAATLSETALSNGNIQIRGHLAMSPSIGDRRIVTPMVSDLVEVTTDGEYVRRTFEGDRDLLAASAYGAEAVSDLSVAYMAVNLMNCKNVRTEDAGRLNVARSGRAKRNNSATLRFSTIVLPGMTRGGTATSDAANAEAMAQHRVRGHFKTYTADAPLLGKHVGTYWWGWQVRGNASRGTVASDYKLGAAS